MIKLLVILLAAVTPAPAPAEFREPNAFRWCVVKSVHDGDTCTAHIEMGEGLGSEVVLTDKVRLYGFDSRELANKPGGVEDRDYLIELLKHYQANSRICIEMMGEDKYGRMLGRLWGKRLNGTGWENLNDIMVKTGHGTAYFGGKRDL